MKHTTPNVVLTRQLLCFVRDQQPTVQEFLAQFGGPSGQTFHLLRKLGIIVVDGDRVRLSRRHLNPNGQRFEWGIRSIHLDEDIVEIVRRGSSGPPIFSDDA